MKLRVRGVQKAFDDKHVLRGIDLDVATHEVVCLIGASGSGKSTLLKCINLLVPVDAGEVWLDDLRITDRGADADLIRSRMAIVFQSFNLFPHLSVIQNIT
ncbi:MAG: ATP-binding cassette domain-containing protein, partial [Acidimicrobiia bacterium]|nr:ATP-binding cassette domain-containing protein [Acidimicrobiia bacterium]